MGNAQHRRAVPVPQKILHRPVPGRAVQALKGLIQQQQLRHITYCPGNGHPPPLSAGQFRRPLVQAVRQSQLPQVRLDIRPGHGPARDQTHVLHGVQLWAQTVLLKHESQSLRHAGDGAAVRHLQPGDTAQERGLPAAGGGHQTHHRPVRDGQAHVLQHDLIAEALVQMCRVHVPHPLSSRRKPRRSRASTSLSNRALSATITTVQASRSAVWR